MKYTIHILLLLLPLISVTQNNLGDASDYDRISLQVFIPDQIESIPSGSKSLLINKFIQAVA